jgi:TonB family protein
VGNDDDSENAVRKEDAMRLALFTAAALVLSGMVATGQENDTTVYDCCDNGVSPPAVLKVVKPDYTQEARAARIEGIVLVGMVVTADGTPSDVNVIRSLDTKFGLDEQSLKAARQFRFKPGMKGGKPVAVRVTIEMTFSLK